MSSLPHLVLPWAVRRTRLPLLAFACVDCSSERATTGDGRFRVNANGKLLDVWLLVNCVGCDRTSKLTVHHRVPVRSLAAELLQGYTANSAALVATTLADPVLARRNRFALDWNGCWQLHAPTVPDGPWPLTVTVAFQDPVPVRPERLIAHGLGISRNEVLRRVKTDIPLKRKTTADFSFLLLSTTRG
ncbi:DUF1062 domain-containing protein [Nocardiopsis ganjiahuensis]|uniref:DUF1062 domain-containing protein n=1 Tax=Nocardiopsis ganjiahuensis TaxID=239984 RepID=UPI0004764579|nr:DUF1062 domain-containing protein [Nocardiopsis ganjiahuensis]